MSTASQTMLVGIGASAGGVEALLDLVAGLPTDLPAALLVVLHQSTAAPAVLPRVLGRHSALPVEHAEHGAAVVPGRMYVAAPDQHLLVRDGHLIASRGPKENGHRPSVDPLFRSLALEAGPAAVGVVLSGMLDDGADGLLGIVRHGGTAVVQDPADALFPGMPEAALHHVPGALVRPARDLAPLLAELAARRPVPSGRREGGRLAYAVAVAGNDPDTVAGGDPHGPPAGLSCPDCSGPLFDLGEAQLPHYRCRVGHAWSEESLRAEQDGRVEKALYAALQALEEKAAVQQRIHATATERGRPRVAARARDAADDALRSAALVHGLLSATTDGGAA